MQSPDERYSAWEIKYQLSNSVFILSCVLLSLFNDLLSDHFRNVLVAGEFGVEAASGLSDGTKIDSVSGHFSHRRFGNDFLNTSADRVHTEDAAAAFVHIADNVTHVTVGNVNVNRNASLAAETNATSLESTG